MRLLLTFTLCLGLAAGVASRADASMAEIKAAPGGHFITTAEINDSPVRVMVDTGATIVALSFEDAEQAGLDPRDLVYDLPVSTANGMVNAARVTIRRVVVDGVRVDDVPGMVLPEGALNGTLLGMSFLSRLQSFKVQDGVLYLRN
jgi:aspartyl protease family protein